MGCLLLGAAWFLTVANSDYGGPIQLGLGTYQAQSNCSGQAITTTVEINACASEANTVSDNDDTDPTMESTCLVDLATPFAELGVEESRNPTLTTSVRIVSLALPKAHLFDVRVFITATSKHLFTTAKT